MSYTKLSTWACLPRTQRGQPIVLGVDPKQEKLLYANGNSVVIRDLDNPAISDIYTEHSIQVNVAKYSPSGYYIASGDLHGKIRIWDTLNPEHLLKAEYQPLGGAIRDIAWSDDSQRICVVGEGRGKFAHVFMMDTGASVKGELCGHTKAINTVDWKTSRPFRIATGSEDNKTAFYEGPPFSFKCTKSDHSKFVQAVRYAPNGEMFATAGFDGKIFVYDGKEAELLKELGSPAHKGGVYGISWSPDSRQILSASGDKTCKLWDVASATMVTEFHFSNDIEDQQVSCLWVGEHLLSVSLSGFINFLDKNNAMKPVKIVKGHRGHITRVALSLDRNTLYTAGTDGTITIWDVASGTNDRVEGKGHGNQVTGLVVSKEAVFTTGIDDTLRIIDPLIHGYKGQSVPMGSQPKHLAIVEDILLIVTQKELCAVHGNRKVASSALVYDGFCLAAQIVGGKIEVAVGGGEGDMKVHLYSFEKDLFTEKKTLDHLGAITDLSYSPCGEFLAACDVNRKVMVYSVPGYEKYNRSEWGFHNARINCVAWSPNSRMVASGSLDTQIIVWSLDHHNKHIIIKSAHPQSQVTGIVWLDNENLISTGHDGCIRSWNVKF